MRYLLLPENNSLSHIAKAVAIRAGLIRHGHEVLLAVNSGSASFLDSMEIPHVIVSDIQEQDGAGFPSVAWFSKDDVIRSVINQELRLIEEFRPDRILGIFRFTLKAAAEIAGVPYDSLICSCLLPEICDAYGYAAGEPGERQQAELMSGFFRYAGARLSRVMSRFGLEVVGDAREMLLGERTFLWDFPGFMPLDSLPAGCHYVGPIAWNDWPEAETGYENFETFENRPLAILSFGTCVGNSTVSEFIKQVLGDMGYHVLLAAGGQSGMHENMQSEPWFDICRFAPMQQLWPKTELLISHGGQMTIFEALNEGVPVAVMPFQPEQAHNGVCLESIGCGRRLTPGQPFLGKSQIYEEALLNGGKSRLRSILAELTSPETAANIEQVNRHMSEYKGLPNLLHHLEGVS